MNNKKIELAIEGMSCVSCASRIEKALQGVSGVNQAQVFFTTEKAIVDVNEDFNQENLLIDAVSKSGYTAHLYQQLASKKHGHNEFWKFAFSALFTFPLFVQMLLEIFGYKIEIPGIIEAVLATIVQFVFGWQFYEGGFKAIRYKSANMDLLIAIGTTAAYGLSLAIYFLQLPMHLYFESSAMIITLILLGRWLEMKTRKETSKAIEKLLLLEPKKAWVEIEGTFVQKNPNEIQIGDIFLVKPGETVPIDGVIIEGESTIDESMLTGESQPVIKNIDSIVYAATMNQNGSLKARATQKIEGTIFSKIIELVENAQNSKAPIQKLADVISSYFVPIVLILSLITLIIWFSLGMFHDGIIHAISVLIIACPCALGLATPTVISMATGLAAEEGILFKEASAIQKCGELQTIFFDKTGTLTEGKPKVNAIEVEKGIDELQLLKIALTLATHSNHPISNAIVNYATEKGMRPFALNSFNTISGKGMEGIIDETKYFLGSARYLKEFELFNDRKKDSDMGTLVWSEKEILGKISVKDAIVPHAEEMINQLKNLKIKTIMITGDNLNTAKEIALELGVNAYYAELLPEEKVNKIKEEVAKGSIVGMVGDGINDAPALAAADVGFAIGKGSDIAIETADVTLLKNELMNIVTAISLSKKAFKKIKQNLFFAFVFNSLGIPLAMLGLLNPIIAAGAMALSSLAVITNAILLKK